MKLKDPKYKYNSILLIDDNELDNFINKMMIEATHFSKNVYVSTDGKKALDFVNTLIDANGTSTESYPDVTFVDLNMPVMDGFEFIQQYKKLNHKKLKKSRIVILTSSIDIGDRMRANKIDSNIVFVNKPLTNEFLNSL